MSLIINSGSALGQATCAAESESGMEPEVGGWGIGPAGVAPCMLCSSGSMCNAVASLICSH